MIKAILLDRNFINAVLSSIFLILIGFILRYKRIINERIKKIIIFIVLKITLPALAFCAFMSDFEQKKFQENIIILIVSFVLFVFFLFLGNVLFHKYDKEKRRVYAVFITVGQLTFFSIPVLKTIYGNDIMIMVNMVTFSFRFILYVYCYFVISRLSLNKENIKSSMRKFLLNPVMIAMFIGLFIWLTQNVFYQVKINDNNYSILRIDKTFPSMFRILSLLQSLSTPLAMLVIGFSLGESRISEAFKDGLAWVCAIFRALIVPLIALFITLMISILKIYPVNELFVGTLVLGFAAPLSAVINTYCSNYHNETDIASRTCFLSTLLCIFSIPLLYLLIKVFVEIGIF